jgi:hypothetical protein
MALYSPFRPPTDAASREIFDLVRRVRCFDRSGGRNFNLPLHDPHGVAWLALSDDELTSRMGWCMLPEYHEALQIERKRRGLES